MSWPLASFTLVAAVLVVGWLAYERARPSARMAAVVATLAAVAALGRDAFVALPDVKPITAIVLVVGYALGPLPGFTVGAVGMLASNVMLGQGSYTPWQMAAWGLVGLLGAVMGRLSRRRLSRLQLALACGATALLAKEIMNLYTWTIGASHTPAAFLLIAGGAALPFDLADTAASFFFGLAFAPELARVLGRARARMDVRWEPAGAASEQVRVLSVGGSESPGGGGAGVAGVAAQRAVPLAVLAVGLACALPGAADTAHAGTGASTARIDFAPEVAYLTSAQNADGGWGAAPGQPTSELYSAWAAIGLAAAGRNPQSVRRDGHTVVDALRAQAGTLEGVGDYERTMLALRACKAPVATLAGKNLLAGVLRQRERDGAFANQVNITAFAVFALRAAGRPASDPTVRAAGAWIARQQNANGGFGFDARGTASDVDDTAAALQALIDANIRFGAGVEHAVAFILHAQNPDGGFPAKPGGESNAQSTAWAVQGLVASGRNVEAIRHNGSRTPLGYLQSLAALGGGVRYSRTGTQTPVWVTAQALTALARAPFPVG